MPGPHHEITHRTHLGTWRLTSAAPAADLAGLVHEYWEVEGRLDAFREALLPNGCVEVMVNLGPPHRVFEGAGTGVWDEAWYSGLHQRAIFIESMEGTHLVSARLHPLAGTRLLGLAAARAANSVTDLSALLGAEARELRRKLLAAGAPGARFEVLERVLRRRLEGALAVPPFVAEAAARIERAHGKLRVATMHEDLGVSRKHLAVFFQRYAGVTTKAYAALRRFVWTLDRLREMETVEWSKLAVDAGYSDQAHLVRDFRRVGAASPTEYLRRLAPDGDALLEAVG